MILLLGLPWSKVTTRMQVRLLKPDMLRWVPLTLIVE